MSGKDKCPLPLADLLRDLALIRVSDTDLSKVLDESSEQDESVERSRIFVREARAALKVQNRGDVGRVGDTLNRVREGFEVLKELDAAP